MSERLEKGFKCECGKYHEYPGYVFAHYDVELIHTCEDCGRKHLIYTGIATLMEK